MYDVLWKENHLHIVSTCYIAFLRIYQGLGTNFLNISKAFDFTGMCFAPVFSTNFCFQEFQNSHQLNVNVNVSVIVWYPIYFNRLHNLHPWYSNSPIHSLISSALRHTVCPTLVPKSKSLFHCFKHITKFPNLTSTVEWTHIYISTVCKNL